MIIGKCLPPPLSQSVATSMWVFCGGMVRSGSTLQYQLAAQLVERAQLGQRLGWIQPEEFPRLRESQASVAGWKVVKSHICTAEIQEEFRKGNAKGVYIYRDLRAVVVSAMGKFSKSFDELVGEGFVEGCLAEYDRWTNLPNLLISRYEDVIAYIPKETARIAAHLGMVITGAECEQIAAEYTPEKQRRRIQVMSSHAEAGERSGSVPYYDPLSLLHPNHFGAVSGEEWRSVLSKDQILSLEEKAGGWMLSHGYPTSQPKVGQKRAEPTMVGVGLPEDAYYGQYGEDYLLWKFFEGKTEGFFVDVGAFDGVFLSNSLWFERNGWEGICVEPHPDYYPLCERNRQKSICLNLACVAEGNPRELEFFAEPSGLFSLLGEAGGISLRKRFEEAWGVELKEVRKVLVATATLDEILSKLLPGGRSIDFVSIDVEGNELDVLKGFDLLKFCPRVLIVETNSEEARANVSAYLHEFGYKEARSLYVNTFYVRTDEDVQRLRSILVQFRCAQVQHPLGRAFTPTAQMTGEYRSERELILQQWASESQEQKQVLSGREAQIAELRKQLEEKEHQIQLLAAAAEERLAELQLKEEVIQSLAAKLKPDKE